MRARQNRLGREEESSLKGTAGRAWRSARRPGGVVWMARWGTTDFASVARLLIISVLCYFYAVCFSFDAGWALDGGDLVADRPADGSGGGQGRGGADAGRGAHYFDGLEEAEFAGKGSLA